MSNKYTVQICLSIVWGGFQRLTSNFFAAVRAANSKHLCWTDKVKSQKSFLKKWRGVKHISVPNKYDRSCESRVHKGEREGHSPQKMQKRA